ncbi:MAG TPA: hypothetical protein VFJ15_11085 [Oleiagrimonas sp.]|nr:hypothetical protein [Oleiagrimonas sp.]
MTAAYLLLSIAAALGMYLCSQHQQLWPAARRHPRLLRVATWTATALATLAAIATEGLWGGVFAALTVLMLGLVVLPYLDAWQRLQRERKHVG